jgi:hypothetical protein
MRQTGGWRAARARRIEAVLGAVEVMNEQIAQAPPLVTGPKPGMGRPTRVERVQIDASLAPLRQYADGYKDYSRPGREKARTRLVSPSGAARAILGSPHRTGGKARYGPNQPSQSDPHGPETRAT